MTEDFKKWLYKTIHGEYITLLFKRGAELELLIKAMWAINREGKWWITIYPHGIHLKLPHRGKGKDFEYKQHNNSETEALTKALEYIYKQEGK